MSSLNDVFWMCNFFQFKPNIILLHFWARLWFYMVAFGSFIMDSYSFCCSPWKVKNRKIFKMWYFLVPKINNFKAKTCFRQNPFIFKMLLHSWQICQGNMTPNTLLYQFTKFSWKRKCINLITCLINQYQISPTEKLFVHFGHLFFWHLPGYF